MAGREVVIAAGAVRTPVGRGDPEKGYYRNTHANDLLGACYSAVLERAGVDAAEVEDAVAGCVIQFGEHALNIGRNAWLQAGLPYETPAVTVDRQCGSGQQAINFAAALIAAGVHEVAIAGGVEHMGHVPLGTSLRFTDELGTPWPLALFERYDLVPQGISAEHMAEKWQISREELDEFSLRSHRLAAQATDERRYERELVPMTVLLDGHAEVADADQGIRRDSSTERLGRLRPVFKEDGRVTAGNSSQISDGASAVLLMTRDRADELGVRPRARILDQTTVGVDPVLMLTGPIPATQKLLDRNGMTIDDVGRFEVNEAFASVPIAWMRELKPDADRVNVNGGAIALGHPLGCSGARLVTSMLHELERSDTEIGLVTMCCGGGLGTGTLIQRL